MKRYIIFGALLFSLSLSPQTIPADAAVDVVERVSQWDIEKVSIYGVLCVLVLGFTVIAVRQNNHIKELNSEVKNCHRDGKKDEVELLKETLDKYMDLAIKQQTEAAKIIDMLTDIKTRL